ncbi:MAG: hypothetical protein ACYCS4_05080 [Acidimicrobiales bacterium]
MSGYGTGTQIDGSGSSLAGAEGAVNTTAHSGANGAPEVPFCAALWEEPAVVLARRSVREMSESIRNHAFGGSGVVAHTTAVPVLGSAWVRIVSGQGPDNV